MTPSSHTIAEATGAGRFGGPVSPFLAAATWLLAIPTTGFAQPTAVPLDPRSAHGLVALWDFREPAGALRRDQGPYAYPLQERNGPIDRVWGMRTAAFADPDGHVWEVAQQLAES